MRVYQGKLNTNTSYATKDEVVTFTTSGSFEQGTPAIMTGQWTQSYKGVPKQNYCWSGTVTKSQGNQIELFVGEDQYYWFTGTISGDQISLKMSKEGMENYGQVELTLKYSQY